MIPTNNGSTSPCDPLSSNCVVWQGPDISCINLCNGDTISDVVSKMATQLCDLVTQTCQCNPDLSGLTLDCIPAPPQQDPNLTQYMQAIVDYVCTLPTSNATTINVELPDCLHYTNSQGNPVTSLPIDEYAKYLANEICTIKSAINIINNQIFDIASRLSIVESYFPIASPTSEVISSCILQGQTVPVSTLLLALETEFCNLRTAVGDAQAINFAINASCLSGTSNMLSQGGTYGSQSGWIQNPNTLADINANQWVAICDIYDAVANIQQNCCVSDCSAVSWAMTYNVVTDPVSGLPTTINFNLNGSTVPSGFTDCGNSFIEITDASGAKISQSINAANLASSSVGVNIDLTNSNLILTYSLSVVAQLCATDNNNVCQEIKNITIPLGIPCPTSSTLTPSTDSIVVAFPNSLTGSNYTYRITCNQGPNVVAATTIANPGANISYTFTGLSSATLYTIQINITDLSTQQQRACTLGATTTLGVSCTSLAITDALDEAAVAGDYYIGQTGTVENTKRFYYRPGNSIIRQVGEVSLFNPDLTVVSVTAGGNVTINVERNTGGTGTPTTIIYDYSADMITWTNGGSTTTNPDNGIVIATGITTKSIYVRARQNDGGSNYSEYTIVRYDFNTDQTTTIQDPANDTPSFLTSQPSGFFVSYGTLTCGTLTETIPGGNLSESVWYYVGKIEVNSVTQYIYAGWSDATETVTKVVACCECPAFLLTSTTSGYFCNSGSSTTIEIPYVIGDGEPALSIVANPQYGTVTQSPTDANTFTYTHNGASSYGDTFEVRLTSDTAGDCSSVTAIVQVQIIQPEILGAQVSETEDDFYMFVDTNSFSVTDAVTFESLKARLEAWLALVCTAWSGEIFLIPTTSRRWLQYSTAVVENGQSATGAVGAPLDGASEWVAIQDLPTDWGSAPLVAPPTRANILVFSNNTNPEYHGATLSSGFGSPTQPTANYLEDYEIHTDILTGSANSAYGVAKAFGGTSPFTAGMQVVYYPITADTAGQSASAILQGLASYTAKMTPPSEYGVRTAVDVTGYLMQGVTPSATNPYEGASTGAITLEGLYKKSVLMFLNQPVGSLTVAEYLTAIYNGTDDGDFQEKMKIMFVGHDDLCPDSTSPASPAWPS